MSDPQPVVKNEKDLGFAMALAQSLTEPMNIEKDAANVRFLPALILNLKNFVVFLQKIPETHTNNGEILKENAHAFPKNVRKHRQRRFSILLSKNIYFLIEIKPSLEQFEFILQISWLFAASLNRQKSLPKDLWRLMFPVIHAMLEFCAFIIQYLSKQVFRSIIF